VASPKNDEFESAVKFGVFATQDGFTCTVSHAIFGSDRWKDIGTI